MPDQRPGWLLLPPAAFIGKTVAEVMPPTLPGRQPPPLQALATGETQSFGMNWRRPAGVSGSTSASSRCLRTKLLAITRDISAKPRTPAPCSPPGMRLHLLAFAATHSLDELLQETLDRVGGWSTARSAFTILSNRTRRRLRCRLVDVNSA